MQDIKFGSLFCNHNLWYHFSKIGLSSSFVDNSISCSCISMDSSMSGICSEFVPEQKGSTPSREYQSEEFLQIVGSGLHEEPLSVDSRQANLHIYF